MSWTNELYKIYEYNIQAENTDMPPVSHTTAKAQIEVTIDENGVFMSAATVDKKNAETIIPVTEDSGARANGICPRPLADKLKYIAGDYGEYTTDNSKYFDAYMQQLTAWRDSAYSHPAVKAIAAYLEKRELMHDLIGCGILQTDPETGKLTKNNIEGIAQEDALVRFIVRYNDLIVRYNDRPIEPDPKTWKDGTLYSRFEQFHASTMRKKQLCYAKGTVETVTYKHPYGILCSEPHAKLISANEDDKIEFTYRGRFSGKEEALSVSYDFSQKIHNALKWLIQKQGIRFDTLTLIVWASALQKLPPIDKDFAELEDPYPDEQEEQIPDTMPKYRDLVRKMILGYKDSLQPQTKVMLMGLDAATPGRLSIAVYAELEDSQFFANLKKWHTETAWLRCSNKYKTHCINSFSVLEIIRCAYGTQQQSGSLACDDKLIKRMTLRLLPCITEGRKIPHDLVRSLCQRASNPQAYEKNNNHRMILETACAMVRKEYLDERKGELTMAFDPNETDRSYLFGCLLAIADKAESDTYDEDKQRTTNARRYWSAFASRPSQTWMVIEERLRPYMDKLDDGNRVYYERLIGEITSKMSPTDFADNSRLNPLYLLGYHHYNAKLYEKKTNKED